jgi:hypothetical protein
LLAYYSNGVVSISAATSFEGDVYPRPIGDGAVSLGDWLTMGRYVARLDYPTNSSEFQRADCAPRSTLGDGAIRISDWVQAGRYAEGLDPLTPSGGPTNELVGPGAGPSAMRIVSLNNVSLNPGQQGTISVTLAAQANENALGFSLSFNPSLAAWVGAAVGTDAAGATLFVNTNQSAVGRLGFALALSAGASLPAGAREIARVTFTAAGHSSGSFSLTFSDSPVTREVADTYAAALPASYTGSTITVVSQPTVQIQRIGTNVVLAWPLWASNYALQEATGLIGPWSNSTATVMTTNGQYSAKAEIGGARKLYRLLNQTP